MGFAVERRTASTTSGPIVMFGTKRPSMTSTWYSFTGAGGIDGANLFAQAREVRGQYGRRD